MSDSQWGKRPKVGARLVRLNPQEVSSLTIGSRLCEGLKRFHNDVWVDLERGFGCVYKRIGLLAGPGLGRGRQRRLDVEVVLHPHKEPAFPNRWARGHGTRIRTFNLHRDRNYGYRDRNLKPTARSQFIVGLGIIADIRSLPSNPPPEKQEKK